MKTRTKILVPICFILIFLVGLGFIFSDQIRNQILEKSATEQQDRFKKMSAEDIQTNLNKEGNYDSDQVTSINSNDIIKNQLSTPPESAFNLIAMIGIPSVDLNVPIYNGLDNYNLTYGAGTFSAEQRLGHGNYALASHRADVDNLLFTPLERVVVGAPIYVTDKQKVYEYTTTNKMRVFPNESSVLNEVEGKTLITLVTCADAYARKRLIVQGELFQSWEYEETPKDILKYFNGAKTTY